MSYIDPIITYIDSEESTFIKIPDCQEINNLLEKLTLTEKEHLYLFLNRVFIFSDYRKEKISEFRTVFDIELYPYEVFIFYYIRNELLTQRHDKKIMDLCEEYNIINFSRVTSYDLSIDKYSTNIFRLNKNVLFAQNKTVQLTKKPIINIWKKWLRQRQKPFTSVDRDIVNHNHAKLYFNITSEEFYKKYHDIIKQECIEENIQENKKFNEEVYEKHFSSMCNHIDEFNNSKNNSKWILCTVDPFGHRLHHFMTTHWKYLRKYAVIDRTNKYIPNIEIDLTSAQPFILGSMMLSANIFDKDFIDDLNSGLFYERYASKRFPNKQCSREVAKTLVYRAIYGNSKNPEMIEFAKIYPEVGKYLISIKSTYNSDFASELPNYKKSKNNCISAQRYESTWGREVWKTLLENKIRFLPIHDSVLIFDKDNLSPKQLIDLRDKVLNIMKEKFNYYCDERLQPKFKTTWFVTEPISELK